MRPSILAENPLRGKKRCLGKATLTSKMDVCVLTTTYKQLLENQLYWKEQSIGKSKQTNNRKQQFEEDFLCHWVWVWTCMRPSPAVLSW